MNTIPEYKQRINARRIMLEAEITARQNQLQVNAQHFVASLPTTIKEEVLDEVKESNPMVAKVINMVQGKPEKKRNTRGAGHVRSLLPTNLSQNVFRTVLPFVYTIGTQKILSYSLRSAGKLVRFGLRRLFGIGKRRRK